LCKILFEHFFKQTTYGQSLQKSSRDHVLFSAIRRGRGGNQFGKGQLVALDTLYFKDPILDENVVSLVDSIKLIGMADLFEHHAYALQLAEYFHEKEILDHKSFDIIIDYLHINCKSTLKEKVFLKMLSFAKRRFLLVRLNKDLTNSKSVTQSTLLSLKMKFLNPARSKYQT